MDVAKTSVTALILSGAMKTTIWHLLKYMCILLYYMKKLAGALSAMRLELELGLEDETSNL